MSFFHSVILAIVEGLTEFLPVSSTGHMILADWVLGGSADPEFLKLFVVQIQFGAIASVLVLYAKTFFQSWKLYQNLFVAFLPAAVLGFLFGDFIDLILDKVWVVGVMLLVGGVVLLFVDTWFEKSQKKDLNLRSSFFVGLFQCIAMIPGVSRSAATIVGAMANGVSRTAAAEFSFFLAVPTMFAASVYMLLKVDKMVLLDHLDLLIWGNVIAFFVAMLAIRGFVSFLQKKGFALFGWYRIVIGILILLGVWFF